RGPPRRSSRPRPVPVVAVRAVVTVRAVLTVRSVLPDQRVELVLEPAGVDGAVDAALLRSVLLPPPPAGPVGLAVRDGPRAGRAPDGRVALVVQRVVRHVVRPDVVPHLALGPVGQRVDLGDA